MSNRSFVSVEQESAQATHVTPNNSPEKIYTSLKVTSPQAPKHTESTDSPNIPPLQIDEGITDSLTGSETLAKDVNTKPEENRDSEGNLTSQISYRPEERLSPVETMDEPMSGFSQGVLDDFITQGSSQDHSSRFGQYLHPLEIHGAESTTSQVHEQVVSLGNETVENHPANLIAPGSINFPESGFANFSITRQEVLVLSNVLGRIPQTFITGEEGELGQTMALTVVDDISPTVIATTSSQEEMLAQSSSGTTQQQTEHGPPEVRGKRRRPKYSLTGSIFKRHPIMKFSATGPLDRDRSPYKWW